MDEFKKKFMKEIIDWLGISIFLMMAGFGMFLGGWLFIIGMQVFKIKCTL